MAVQHLEELNWQVLCMMSEEEQSVAAVMTNDTLVVVVGYKKNASGCEKKPNADFDHLDFALQIPAVQMAAEIVHTWHRENWNPHPWL